MKSTITATAILLGLAAVNHPANATVNFSPFVSGAAIAANEGGNQSTIAFNYTGTGFVGSVYFGPDNNRLYSTDLSGGSVAPFGQPIPGFSGEVVVGVGLGQADSAVAPSTLETAAEIRSTSFPAAARPYCSAPPATAKISDRSSSIPAAASAARCW